MRVRPISHNLNIYTTSYRLYKITYSPHDRTNNNHLHRSRTDATRWHRIQGRTILHNQQSVGRDILDTNNNRNNNEMKAEELRIGNYAFSQSINGEFKISNLTTDYDPTCLPIPLTEDWLIRFGFIQISALEFRNKKRLIMKRGENYYDYGTDVHIEYVHQLQNFYYALTQTELTTTK